MGGTHHDNATHGHHHHHDQGSKTYDHLLRRLDANPVTIPKTPFVKQLLSLLFNEEEAELVSRMPGELANAETISTISGLPFKISRQDNYRSEEVGPGLGDGLIVIDTETSINMDR